MDFTAPISKFMTTRLVTVEPHDRMTIVKVMFDKHHIHHLPVVKDSILVGIISKTDYLHFLQGKDVTEYDQLIENSRLHSYTAEDVMTRGIATLESSERINVALAVFSENLFHAIPIVDKGLLVGILTTHDIIKLLMEEDRVRMQSN